MKPRIVIICGPTATGKTACAIDVARKFDGEIVNADSMQSYRRLSIGTAKPTPEELASARFHLVDAIDVNVNFSAGFFKELADAAIAEIVSRNKLPVIAGGTGLYLKALTQGLFEGPGADFALRERLAQQEAANPGSLYERLRVVDPEKAAGLPPTDSSRIMRALEVFELTGVSMTEHQRAHAFAERPYHPLWIGLEMDRERLYARINERVDRMMEVGWLDEVRHLMETGFDHDCAAAGALGYRTLMAHLRGEIDLADAVERIKTDTRKFAKRQLTWYRANPEIHWLAYPEKLNDILNTVDAFLRGE